MRRCELTTGDLGTRRGRRRLAGPVAGLLVVLGCLGPAAAPAFAADFTWTGMGVAGTTGWNWSNPANWAGASAPSGAIGTLTFPLLPSVACPPEPSGPTATTCYLSNDDLSGISAEALVLDDGVHYQIGPTSGALELGSGGIVATTTQTGPAPMAILELPLTLTANQAWSINATGNRGGILLEGKVEGPTHKVAVEFGDGSFISDTNDVEVGDMALSGEGDIQLLGFSNTPSLNGTDGHWVGFDEGAGLFAAGRAITGPLLLAQGGELDVGSDSGPQFNTGAGLLTVHGEVTLSPGSEFGATINTSAGTTAGTDYSQLSAEEDVELGGAALDLADGLEPRTQNCQQLTPGYTATLITTPAALDGTFKDVPNGSAVPVECYGEGEAPWARIEYHESGPAPHTVTATILERAAIPVPADLAPPTITGVATEGQVLTLAPGSWADSPSAVADQWEACDSSGANCQPIAGAGESTYTLPATAVGHRIRVRETATNPGGSATALSSPTAVVQPQGAAAGGGAPVGGSGGGSPAGGTGPSTKRLGPTPALRIVGGTLRGSHGKVAVRLRCIGSGRCKGTGTLTSTGRPPKPLGKGKFSLRGGTAGKLVIPLDATALRELRGGRKTTARLVVVGTASGEAVRRAAKVTLVAAG